VHNVAVIIPVHNRREVTLQCLKRLQNIKHDNFNYHVIVIDDGSNDGTTEAVANNFPSVTILNGNGNLWWAGGINVGLRHAQANKFDFIYSLNDDVAIQEDTLQKLYSFAVDNLGAHTSVAVDPDNGKICDSGYIISGFLRKMRPVMKGILYNNAINHITKVDAISSMSTLIPISIVNNVGYYDETNFPHNYSDIDYSIRIKFKSYDLFVNPNSFIYSKGSGSNFHYLVLNMSAKDLFRSFFDLKYGHNLKTLFNSARVRTPFPLCCLIFFHRLFPYLTWFILKAIFPKEILKAILIKTNRI